MSHDMHEPEIVIVQENKILFFFCCTIKNLCYYLHFQWNNTRTNNIIRNIRYIINYVTVDSQRIVVGRRYNDLNFSIR